MLYQIISITIYILIIYWLYRAKKLGKVTLKSIIKIAIATTVLYLLSAFIFLFIYNCNHEIFVINKSKNSIFYDFNIPQKDVCVDYAYEELKPNETILLKRFGLYGYNKFSLGIQDKEIGIYKTIEFKLMPNGGFDYQHQIIIEDSLNYKLGNFRLEYNKRK